MRAMSSMQLLLVQWGLCPADAVRHICSCYLASIVLPHVVISKANCVVGHLFKSAAYHNEAATKLPGQPSKTLFGGNQLPLLGMHSTVSDCTVMLPSSYNFATLLHAAPLCKHCPDNAGFAACALAFVCKDNHMSGIHPD